MSDWSVFLSNQAKEDLAGLDSEVKNRVLDKMRWLSKNFELITPIPLQGEFSDFFKLRVGDWRVIYKVSYSKEKIVVHYIDHRSEIYN
ncbi:MAG: type II toxin-antitoxin system RelE/ParE family toxin [Candidatus Paceibacteria bacterium]